MSSLTVERNLDNIRITIPSNVNIDYVEQILDYLKVKSVASQSQATDFQIVEIANEINQNWWLSNKHRFVVQ